VKAREIQVLAAAAEGLCAEETGRRLRISAWTVKDYRRMAIASLGARNTTHAVALALRRGLL
jgi:DNA-binding CsgD family transcriptional regulator